MSSAHFAAYWANREPVRGRYTDERDDPLRVEDVLRQAHEEGRPLKPVRLVDQSASLLPLAEEELTTLLPAVTADQPMSQPAHGGGVDGQDMAHGFHGHDDPTEPNTAVRLGRKWLSPTTFSWWPQALAG